MSISRIMNARRPCPTPPTLWFLLVNRPCTTSERIGRLLPALCGQSSVQQIGDWDE